MTRRLYTHLKCHSCRKLPHLKCFFVLYQNLKDEARDTSLISPLPQVGPAGGDHIYIRLFVLYIHKKKLFYTHTTYLPTYLPAYLPPCLPTYLPPPAPPSPPILRTKNLLNDLMEGHNIVGGRVFPPKKAKLRCRSPNTKMSTFFLCT